MKILAIRIVALGLVSSVLISTPALASVYLYHAPGVYDEASDRKQSSSNGIYIDSETIELGLEQTTVEYNNNLLVEQIDVTAVGKLQGGYMKTFRFGAHYTSSDDLESRGKITLILDGVDYADDVLGSALYYTKYDNDEMDMWQFSPRIGRYYWPSFLRGSVYLQAQANVIAVSSEDDSQTYSSLNVKSHWSFDPWGIELGAWAGKQRSAVTDGGFTVYNLNDIYSGGVRLSTTVKLGEQSFLKLGSQLNRRQTSENKEAHLANTWVMGFSHAF